MCGEAERNKKELDVVISNSSSLSTLSALIPSHLMIMTPPF
jgi:hypothetical protein